jgi:hypothetical protein
MVLVAIIIETVVDEAVDAALELMDMAESSTLMTTSNKKEVYMYHNQQRRRVLVDEQFLRQLLNRVQVPEQQALVSQQEALPAEYTIPADDTAEDTASGRNRSNIRELDLNQNRNQILDETFHA